MDKYELVLDIIEHPDKYTSQELEEIMTDSETRDLYNILCKVDSAIEANKEIDVDAEWTAFSRKASFRRRNFFMRNSRVASIIAIIGSQASITHSHECHSAGSLSPVAVLFVIIGQCIPDIIPVCKIIFGKIKKSIFLGAAFVVAPLAVGTSQLRIFMNILLEFRFSNIDAAVVIKIFHEYFRNRFHWL